MARMAGPAAYNPPEIMTLREAAEYCRMSESYLRRCVHMRQEGTSYLEHMVYAKGKIMIRRGDLDAWLFENFSDYAIEQRESASA